MLSFFNRGGLFRSPRLFVLPRPLQKRLDGLFPILSFMILLSFKDQLQEWLQIVGDVHRNQDYRQWPETYSCLKEDDYETEHDEKHSCQPTFHEFCQGSFDPGAINYQVITEVFSSIY